MHFHDPRNTAPEVAIHSRGHGVVRLETAIPSHGHGTVRLETAVHIPVQALHDPHEGATTADRPV
jgi:hypothetical protein